MFDFDACKGIAEKKAEEYNASIDTAYKIGNDYAFDNTSEKWTGVFPFIVETATGAICGLWEYLIRNDMTMDDLQEMTV